ncbi:MAG: MBL fold metallo-hydrolase [Gemmatimonadota bacterium]
MTRELQLHSRIPIHDYIRFARRFAREAMHQRRQGRNDRPPIVIHRPDPSTWQDSEVTAAWLGHATVLINFLGTWLITDPALARRIGVRFAGITIGPRRITRPGLTVRDIPSLDLILISHAHMDHLDLATLGQLPRQTPVVTHRGVGDLLKRFDQVTEVGWGEHLEQAGVSIEGIGARHWGARTITDRQRGFGGFLLEKEGRRILFAGDTAYTNAYTAIARGGPVDLAILPIGAYDPWIANHASPEEAWAMSRDMQARFVLPVHHSTFRLSREPLEEPLRRLIAAAGNQSDTVVGTRIGETIRLPVEGVGT